MRKFYFVILSLLISFEANQVNAGDWKLVWSDEFNYQGLPDKTKWDYEEGFIRNHESQYYTRARLENARVENGNLVIECRKEHFTPKDYAPVEYTSASLTTLNQASWQYGRIEVRAKLPYGKGVWPAIWTLGANRSNVRWPACGEIDIMEYIGRDTNGIHGNAHFAVNGRHQDDSHRLEADHPSDDFHVYAVEWDARQIDFYFDTYKYHTIPIDQATTRDGYNPFRAPQYLILNFALGGEWGGPVDDAVLPQKFLIDYVRVYQKSEKTNAAPADVK